MEKDIRGQKIHWQSKSNHSSGGKQDRTQMQKKYGLRLPSLDDHGQ
jgi:hypothetical protein